MRIVLIYTISTIHTIMELGLLFLSYLRPHITAGESQQQPSSRDCAPRLLYLFSVLFSMSNRAASRALLSLFEVLIFFANNLLDRCVFCPIVLIHPMSNPRSDLFGYNRLIPYLLLKYLFTEKRMLDVVRATQSALFPNGYPGPPIVEPPLEEQVRMREEVARRVEGFIPSKRRPFHPNRLTYPPFRNIS